MIKFLDPGGSPSNPKSVVMEKYRLKITVLWEHLCKCTL